MKRNTTSAAAKERKEYYKRYASIPENRARINAAGRASRTRLRNADPLRFKAMMLASGMQWGRGATDKLYPLLSSAIGTPCKYCKMTLTLKSMSLDHKTPADPPNNDIRNLHIVCLSCNRTKSSLTDEQFTSLLAFLANDDAMRRNVIGRLKGGNFIFGRNH